MKIVKDLTPLLSVLVISIIAFFGFQKLDRYLDMTAVHDCAYDYRSETVDNQGKRTVRPLEQQVKECVWQKGVQNWNGVWSK